MRVLFISHQANRSGAPYALFQELEALQHGSDIQPIVMLLEGGAIKKDFQKSYPTVGWHDMILRIIIKCRLERLFLKYYSIDCIYCNSIVSLDVGLILKKNSNIPLILHVHESESYLNSYARSKNYLCDVDSFITVSGLCKNILIEKYGVSPDKVYIQYPFSPWVMNVIENNIEGISGEKKAELTIGTICNGTWPKAPELITLVADLFYKKFPHIKCKFMVVGISKESDTYYHIEYDLEKMHLQDKVTLAGQVNDPLDCYSQFDVLLLHSREESFSLVAEEAAVMGKPIVGFEGATGAAEWIKDECGILVPYMDLNALAEALYKLCSNDQLRMELGKNAKRKMVNIYKEEAQMKNVISALHSVVHLH